MPSCFPSVTPRAVKTKLKLLPPKFPLRDQQEPFACPERAQRRLALPTGTEVVEECLCKTVCGLCWSCWS